jgi:hypothetical protein
LQQAKGYVMGRQEPDASSTMIQNLNFQQWQNVRLFTDIYLLTTFFYGFRH